MQVYDESIATSCKFSDMIGTECPVSLGLGSVRRNTTPSCLSVPISCFVFDMFVEPDEFVIVLDGLVAFAGVIEAGDGDGDRKEVASGNGGIGRVAVCIRDEGRAREYVRFLVPSFCHVISIFFKQRYIGYIYAFISLDSAY